MFGTMEAFNKEQVTAKVDSTKKVEQACAFIDNKGYIKRFRLMDDEGMDIIDITLGDQEAGEWVFREIPEGKEVVGIYCNTTSNTSCIESLGLIIWKPKTINST